MTAPAGHRSACHGADPTPYLVNGCGSPLTASIRGGEWISSIEIENTAMGHPEVAEAAVIGVKHPKWDERPLLIVVPKPGKAPTKESVFDFLTGEIAKWWMPDDVVFVAEIPHTATGKVEKRYLKDQYKDYKLPTA